MRLQVLVNSSGAVLGTITREPQQLDDGSRIDASVLAQEGQTLHEIDVPEDFAEMEVEEFHRKVGELVRRK